MLIIFFYNYVYLSPPLVVLAAKDGSRLVAKVGVHMHGHAVEPLYCGYHRVLLQCVKNMGGIHILVASGIL